MSDTVSKNLGVITAYGMAVQGGYTGTKEDFYALLGHIESLDLNIQQLDNKADVTSDTIHIVDSILVQNVVYNFSGQESSAYEWTDDNNISVYTSLRNPSINDKCYDDISLSLNQKNIFSTNSELVITPGGYYIWQPNLNGHIKIDQSKFVANIVASCIVEIYLKSNGTITLDWIFYKHRNKINTNYKLVNKVDGNYCWSDGTNNLYTTMYLPTTSDKCYTNSACTTGQTAISSVQLSNAEFKINSINICAIKWNGINAKIYNCDSSESL